MCEQGGTVIGIRTTLPVGHFLGEQTNHMNCGCEAEVRFRNNMKLSMNTNLVLFFNFALLQKDKHNCFRDGFYSIYFIK